MQYLAEQIVSRPDGEKFLPLLEKLKAEHDSLVSTENIRDFARKLAAGRQPRDGGASQGEAVKLGRVA
ncbi:hypothetical protein [Tabrizicola sp. TH137]|uniref:hypothetical protein n=1 Tax=Tabrizicola sp. TH137 TaxID=2067452 RepID=UPI001C1FD655|nr:hypothetical protein [Tabrizicola sp. TH137]